jgi:hypothetical protein
LLGRIIVDPTMHRALFALWIVLACTPQTPATTHEGPSTPQPTAVAELEILGVMQTFDGLAVQLRSGGCRDKTNVDFAVVEDKLVIERVESDSCEAEMPLGEKLLFTWDELPAFGGGLGFTPGLAPVLEPGTTPGPTTAPGGVPDEWIYGVLVTSDGLDIRVLTGGCTGVEDFTSWIEPSGKTELVHLIRTRIDGCEAYVPEGVLLHFTWAQLGVTKGEARLVNPIQKLPPR